MSDQSTSPVDPRPARLLITRSSERDARQRQIFVSMDGDRVGDLVFGETLSREMPPGEHVVRIHNTLFWKTVVFTAEPGETVHFETINYAGKGFLHFVLILGVAPMFLEVERVKTGG